MGIARDIIWGKRPIHSRLEFKYALLRGQFSLIIILVGLFYSILDPLNNVYSFMPWYGVMILMGVLALILNRRQRYTLSTIIILFIVNFIVYLFADSDNPEVGVFLYFLPASMVGITLLSYTHLRLSIFFAILPVVLGLLAYFFDLNIIPTPVYERDMIVINFIANFCISILVAVFMLQFLINRNKESEQTLLEQNELLEKANKELDHFVYSVSHDLRAPLSSILGLTNVYQLARDEAEKNTMVSMINERAHSLDNFIREVLDYSRNARTDLRIHRVHVRELVDECIHGLLFIPGASETELKINIDPELTVNTDRDRMKVVLSNILSNAFHYRDPNKKSFIDVTSHVTNGQWELVVADNGLGIRDEHVSRIFEMFYKAHHRAQGTGLGLYIVKETLDRLEGNINVQSEFQVGTTFTITLAA